jgi:hypothetical protein
LHALVVCCGSAQRDLAEHCGGSYGRADEQCRAADRASSRSWASFFEVDTAHVDRELPIERRRGRRHDVDFERTREGSSWSGGRGDRMLKVP